MLIFLKGLISDRIEDKISASFTLFSPYTMREAFELSEMYKSGKGVKLKELETWGVSMKKTDIDILFSQRIFPLSVTKGAEWFSTAREVKQLIEQYLVLDMPTRDGLFDFISIAEESYIERDIGSKITLTTVHKAKGRDFDIVIYIPSSAPERTSFVDIIVEAILESNDIKVKEELEEESLRVDFVAFTRAKEKLIIITDERNRRNYHVENLCEIEMDDKKDEMVATRLSNKFSEAFSLFVSGRIHDSQKLLTSEDGWLEEFIISYFKNIDHLSYSTIKTDPFGFLIENIIAIPTSYAARDFGSSVHRALAKIITNKASINDFQGDIKRAVENSIKAIDQLKKEYPGLQLIAVEKRRELPLSSMIDYDGRI